MATPSPKPRIFLDSDVLFAGSASPTEHGASLVVLRLGEITLLDCVTSQQCVTEVERNLGDKLPSKLPEFRLIVSRSLRVVPDPASPDLDPHRGRADPKDLPILVAALREGCSHLLTFNVRDYTPPPEMLIVQRPGDFVLTIRTLLNALHPS